MQVERHKGYPAAARARHETGTAELAFSIDRQGMVVASRVVRTSGSATLDQETIDTVKRAQPFPPPPQNVPGMRTILLVILVLLLIGALPTWPYSTGWGWYPGGGLLLLIILVLLLVRA